MARRRHPRFDFYPTNFLDGVRGMPPEEIGDYIRLICAIYDQGGTLENNPNKLRYLLECRKVDVAKRLQKLIDREKLYVDADGFLHNPRADKQMRISPSSPSTSAQVTPQLALKLTPKRAEKPHDSNGAGTPTRATPSPSPDSLTNPSGFVREPSARATPPDLSKTDFEKKFPIWWDAWPHKVGKPRAMQAFPAALQNAGSLGTLVDGAKRYAREKPPDRQWLNPSTWLAEQRWLDEPAPIPVATGPPAESELERWKARIAAEEKPDAKRA